MVSITVTGDHDRPEWLIRINGIRILKHWRQTRRGEAFRAYVVSYADDFVMFRRGHADEALAWTKAVMTKLGLTLNEAKTSVKDARRKL